MERGREEKMTTSLVLKPHSTPATLLWLQANYETVEGVCIPRNAMYSQYVEFCRSNGMMPVNAASFGKIIRQQFSGLTTRRLGTRGQSRYHYYGLAAKSDTNLYAQSSFSRYGFKNSKQTKVCGMTKVTYPTRGHIPNPLFNFPTKEVLKELPKDISKSDTETILIMYTLHCQQLIEFSIHFHFQEVKDYIFHFWEGFPSHLTPFLEHPSILSLIGTCDHITYRAIAHSTMPCVMLEEIPPAKAEHVIHLAEKITDWLVLSLANFPLVLRRMKLHAARTLVHLVRRQSSLNHLCTTFRFILTSEVHLKQMLRDWEHLDFEAVADEMNFSLAGSKVNYASQIIIPYCKDLEKLLRTRPQLAQLRDWMKSLVERCIKTQMESLNMISSGEELKNFACHFVLIWSSIGSRFLRELTLLGAHSFGTFHLLYLMLTDYGALLVESFIMEDRIQRLLANVAMGNPLQNNDFDAGTLCDAQCPCKIMCQPHGHNDQNLSPVNSNSTALHSMEMEMDRERRERRGGGGGGDDSNVEIFTQLPSPNEEETDNSRYFEVFSSTQSGESSYNSVQTQPEEEVEINQEIISRPSCSYQDLTHLPPCDYMRGRHGGEKLELHHSSGVFKNEMKLFVHEQEEGGEREQVCGPFPVTNMTVTDYYNTVPLAQQGHGETTTSSFYMISSTSVSNSHHHSHHHHHLEQCQIMDNFYGTEESMNFVPMSDRPYSLELIPNQSQHHH